MCIVMVILTRKKEEKNCICLTDLFILSLFLTPAHCKKLESTNKNLFLLPLLKYFLLAPAWVWTGWSFQGLCHGHSPYCILSIDFSKKILRGDSMETCCARAAQRFGTKIQIQCVTEPIQYLTHLYIKKIATESFKITYFFT